MNVLTKKMTFEEVKAIVLDSEYVTVSEICYHSDKYGASFRKIKPLKLKVDRAEYYEAIHDAPLRLSNGALDQNGTIVQTVSYTDSLTLVRGTHKVYTNTSTGRTFILVKSTPDFVYEMLFMPGAVPITLKEYEELLQSEHITVTQICYNEVGTTKSEYVGCEPVTYKVETKSVRMGSSMDDYSKHDGIIIINTYMKEDVLGWSPKIYINLRQGTKHLLVKLHESEYESVVRKAKIESLEIELDRSKLTDNTNLRPLQQC